MSNSVQPQRQQPTRLHRLWDSPGKNTGVGCHFLLQCRKVKSESEVAQSCPTLSNPMDCSLPGSSAHGIFQATVLEWGAIAFSLLAYSGKESEKEYIYIYICISESLCHSKLNIANQLYFNFLKRSLFRDISGYLSHPVSILECQRHYL